MSAIDAALWEVKQALDQLGFDVSHGKYPARMLKDVKVAVDELRLTLWAIIEMEDKGKQKKAPRSPTRFREKLAEFRMKRLERMLTDLRSGMTKGAVAGSGAELKTLAASLQATLDSITRLTDRRA